MTLYLYGEENNVDNDDSMKVYVQNLLHLDCLNDTTVCFIPANYEIMDFVLSYNKYLDLTSESDVAFLIKNNQDKLVYEEKVALSDPNPEYPGLYYFTDLSWDGRCNTGDFEDHLADPEAGPYEAYVSLNDGSGLISNIEAFSVVPKIDSILFSNDPNFPHETYGLTYDLYGIIRAKVDDTGDLEQDLKYYKHPRDNNNIFHLNVWKNECANTSFHFWDLQSNPADFHQKYYEQLTECVDLFEWNLEKFGNLDYKWYITHDKRLVDSLGNYFISYEEVVDTTDQWGNDWHVGFMPPLNYSQPDELPYQRFLISSKITNSKNSFPVQDIASPSDYRAHKLIFNVSQLPTFNCPADWALSYIGVPYGWGSKIPYITLDCSGLVTATKIQEIGAANNANLRLGYINSKAYYNGSYVHRGVEYSTLTEDPIQIDQLTPEDGIDRGDLITLTKINNPIDSIAHIVIIFSLDYDYELHVITNCTIIHARGGAGGGMGRVRIDDFLTEYYQVGEYQYRFLNWQ